MTVYADIRAVQDRTSPERGVPKYTAEFAEAASKLQSDLVNRWLLEEGAPIPPFLLGLMSGGRVGFCSDVEGPPEILHNLAPFHNAGKGLSQHDLLDRRFSGSDTRIVATVYDLIPMIYPHIYFRNPTFRDDYLLASSFVQNADLVLAISESAARDAVKYLGLNPRRVRTVGTGVPSSFAPSQDRGGLITQLQRSFPRLRRGFLLFVGGIDFRKNMEGMLRAYALLDAATKHAHPLVVVCRLVGDSGRNLRRLVSQLGIKQHVILTDMVDDQTLTLLYQGTDLFLFPSLYEGFGLPVIEALRSGAPVVVGDNSSLRDIVPVPEARFDASQPSAIASCIVATLADEMSRTRTLREVDHSAHTWEQVVSNTADAYRTLQGRRRRPGTRRLAFVSPMPPAATGIAIYNERLIRELSKLVDVDVFSQPEAASLRIPSVRQFNYGAFSTMRSTENYLDTVLAIGNSYHHINEFEILKRFGGTVMQHDVRVSGLMNNVLATRGDLLVPAAAEEVAELNEREFPSRLGEYPAYDFEGQTQANALMSREITRAADRVLVHSAAGLSIARLEAAPHERGRLALLPLAFQRPKRVDRSHADAITSFGYLSRTKQTPLLCEAFAIAARRMSDVTFAFVGHLGDQTLRKELDRILEDAGVADRVIVTGWITHEEYTAWLGRSILTIQPRLSFNGEASAAVTESVGAGVPTVVSDIGWMGELPDDIVSKIPATITAEHLAEWIVDLADNPIRLESMSRNGSNFAARHDFAAVARQLFAIVSGD